MLEKNEERKVLFFPFAILAGHETMGLGLAMVSTNECSPKPSRESRVIIRFEWTIGLVRRPIGNPILSV